MKTIQFEISQHNVGFDVDTSVDYPERYKVRLGNWTDAGWHWDSEGEALFLFFSRMGVNSDVGKEFITALKREKDFKALEPVLLKDIYKSLNYTDALYGLAGDNARWHFGQDDSGSGEIYQLNEDIAKCISDALGYKGYTEGYLEELKVRLYNKAEEFKHKYVLSSIPESVVDALTNEDFTDRVWNYTEENFDEFIKRSDVQSLLKDIKSEVRTCKTLDDFFEVLTGIDKMTLDEAYFDYAREKMTDAIDKAIEKNIIEDVIDKFEELMEEKHGEGAMRFDEYEIAHSIKQLIGKKPSPSEVSDFIRYLEEQIEEYRRYGRDWSEHEINKHIRDYFG